MRLNKRWVQAVFCLSLWGSAAQLKAVEWNYTADLVARTHAPAFALEPGLGLKHGLWGDPKGPFHGSVRAGLKAALSPSQMGSSWSIDFDPAAFFGVTLAADRYRRFREVKGYDCNANNCLGNLSSTSIAWNFQAAYQSLFGRLQYKRKFYESISGSDQAILDASTALVYPNDGASLDERTLIFGSEIATGLRAGILLRESYLEEKVQDSQHGFLQFKNLPQENLSATLGVGRFVSDSKPAGISVILALNYAGTFQ